MMGCYSKEPNEIAKGMIEKMGEGMSAMMVMQGLIAASEKRRDAGRTNA